MKKDGADKVVKDTLKGQPFIGSSVKYENPSGVWERDCGLCFYRYGHKSSQAEKPDCFIVTDKEKTPHKLFGFKETEYLPEEIDDKKVGNFCSYFLPFTTE